MSEIHIEYPPGFDDYAWEVKAKGWLGGLVVHIQGKKYTVTVYDPTRLAQEIEHDLHAGSVFMERNLIVVRSVTREDIAAALAEVVTSRRTGDLQPDPGDP